MLSNILTNILKRGCTLEGLMAEHKENIDKAIRQVVKQARKRKGLSYRQLAALAECEADLVFHYEAGTRDIRVSSLIKLILALDLSIKITEEIQEKPDKE
ncbi:helix-turn-helix transcriptional regulator [Chitinophaga agrisoli]|uniref:Helix-turn-helix transcriptional regulator n=1 Tax=Chitinophaga agrisoli TaxID=2607653 RepID=A0A5B2W5I3_9BACT|nr:helix-turn-helix transcriptional regulator [Chitinophaga agrisoli]KAA2245479.1 helix-turn-helix transcriptional regulator [Chitinophaga agrisoli]